MRSFRPFLMAPAAIFMLVTIPAPAARAQSFEDQVTEIVNQERWTNGQLPPLKRNAFLDASSETHSSNMAVRDFFQHCDPDNGSLPWDRMVTAGYTGWNSAGENIAAGYGTAQSVMSAWMGSPGHRANILSTGMREIGVGYVLQSGDQGNIRVDQNGDCTSDSFNNGPFGTYWTQNFGRRNPVYPLIVNREAYEASSASVSLYVYGVGWAVDMRFSNESGAWSAWEPYAPDKSWTLSAGNGAKTVTAEIRNGGTTYSNSDTIVLTGSADLAVVVTDDVDPGTVGQNLTYQAVVTNEGNMGATEVTLTQVIPAGMTFVSSSSPSTLNMGILNCTLGTVDPGANVVVDILLTPTVPGDVMFETTVSANEPDPNMANNTGQESTTITSSSVGVPEDGPGPRLGLALHPGRPNPFLGSTRLSWSQPEQGVVHLSIFDAAGRLVTVLLDGPRDSGQHAIDWNGLDTAGRPVSTGIFFARLDVSGRARTIKLIRVR